MDNMSYVLLTEDQHFLLYLIMGAYFAPHLKEESPPKSALQRYAEGLPPYNANDLVASQIKTRVMEKVYYYIMRKADKSAVVDQPTLLEYIHGSVPITLEGVVTYLPFDDLFPPFLHQRSNGTINSIVFANNPYVKPCDVERFKRVTGLEDFRLDWESVMQHITTDGNALCNANVLETVVLGDTMQQTEVVPQVTASFGQDVDHGVLFLPSCPTKEEWSKMIATVKGGSAVTGSAARGHLGPVLGLVDIGESEDSYLFRVSLPGVRRDAREFSCEVESDGTVIIKGVTVSGERVVEKHSQVFEMRTHNLCPAGPFCVSFKLPGPVDPQQFHGTFATDGILEGIALKDTR